MALWDDLQKMKERERETLESFEQAFNEGMRKKGSSTTFRDIMGKPEKDNVVPVSTREVDVAERIGKRSGEGVEDVMRRALGLLDAATKHAEGGGKVEFTHSDRPTRVYKVKLK